VNLDEAWARVGHDRAVMGNLDPVALFAGREHVRREAAKILAQAGNRDGHIFNLGHGILPETPVETVASLVETVHELSRRESTP
jgi:uroporphyrinogen decarboxylase